MVATKYWDKLKKEMEIPDKEKSDDKKSTSKSSWIRFCVVIVLIIGFSFVMVLAALFFIFLGWCFASLWNYAITPIFDVTEITTYMGAALLVIIYGSLRLFKFAFKH